MAEAVPRSHGASAKPREPPAQDATDKGRDPPFFRSESFAPETLDLVVQNF
jgi:hypothetical protein